MRRCCLKFTFFAGQCLDWRNAAFIQTFPSIGKKVSILGGYSYEFYDVGDYLDKVDFASQYARNVVSTFLNEGDLERQGVAQEILGFAYCQDVKAIRNEILSAVESLHFPVHVRSSSKFMLAGRIKLEVARILGKPGILNLSFGDLMGGRLSKKSANNELSKILIDEIDVWQNGVSDYNFYRDKVLKKSKDMIPGYAVNQYE